MSRAAAIARRGRAAAAAVSSVASVPAARFAAGTRWSRVPRPGSSTMRILLALALFPLASLAADELPSHQSAPVPPPITIPEAKLELPPLPTAPDRPRGAPAPQFREIVVPAPRHGGEFAYAKVVADTVDFEIERELPPAVASLDQIRVPLFARADVDAEHCLAHAALLLGWGDVSIREFELVEVAGRNSSPAGATVYWFMPSGEARARYRDVRNEARRIRLSFRQPLLSGRVVFAPSLPLIEFEKDARPWHRQLFIRSLRTNLLGRVSAGVEHERLGDGLLIWLRDEAYVEIVAAPPVRAP